MAAFLEGLSPAERDEHCGPVVLAAACWVAASEDVASWRFFADALQTASTPILKKLKADS